MRPRVPNNISLARILRLFAYLVTFFPSLSASAGAPPGNDNCANATAITISGNGYDVGTFKSSDIDISSATVQSGETFAPAILVASQTQKSIWFKFTIPTTRSVKVTLTQPGVNIAAGDVGFTVYKTSQCLPGNADISTKLTPIALFGNTYHPCVEPGEYLVQVSAKNSANGVLSVQLDIAATNALYDRPKDAYEFGKLTNYVTHVDFDVECQSLDDASEVCTVDSKKMPFTKSTWHTFTTPDYFDYLSVMLAPTQWGVGNNTFGYKLYKGNAKTGTLSSLTLVDGCDSLNTEQYFANYKTYKCGELQPNTTYTVQLFYKQNFSANLRLAIAYGGQEATKGPEPVASKLAAANKLGKLKTDANGETTNASDYLACNSRHAQHACGYALPAGGVEANGRKYNLSTFFTFTLTTTAKVSFSAYNNWCDHGSLLLRLYNKDLTEDCKSLTANDLVKEFTYNTTLECLPAGTYTLQVLGYDTTRNKNHYSYGSLGTSSYPLCIQAHLGSRFNLTLQVYMLQTNNKFSLNNEDAYNALNLSGGVMKPLVLGTEYKAVADTFGCESTVRPDSSNCATYYSNTVTKAMYRQFTIKDSGLLTFSNQNWYLRYKLFQGDAATLATQQDAHAYPKIIKDLTKYTECLSQESCYGTRVCAVPGTYTYVTLGGEGDVGRTDQPYVQLRPIATRFNTPAKAENLGSIIDTVKKTGGSSIISATDRFDCYDNAVTIDGKEPCTYNGKKATKAIYRQFYLSKAAAISINGQHYLDCGWNYGAYMNLFYGKATDGINNLKAVGGQWSCFTSAGSSDRCKTMPAGWYTIVSYGAGPSYEQPLRDVNLNGYGSSVYQTDKITISITQPCASPEYNRPYKAAVDTVAKKPFQIKWVNRAGSTAAYPRTDTTYTLYTEYFDCTIDTPFLYVQPCNNTVNRVAYYVFQTTQEAYVNINTRYYWGAVYAFDVRKDSIAMKTATPIQPCIQSDSQIELCKLQPGTYTLVLFAGDNNICSNVSPIIYVDQVGYSRFDHATNAYDFGVIPADSTWHNGKVGDVNPLNKSRAPSNDFFYCTTGAQEKDPAEAVCNTVYTPAIYKSGNNIYYYDEKNNPWSGFILPRRNLWYTFVVDKGGWVRVKVKSKTPGKTILQAFSVYRSNVDGTLPYSEVVSKGEVDSTIVKGLTFTGTNQSHNYYCDVYTDEVKFYRDPCNTTPERYYILVENSGYYYNRIMMPNTQVEVEILFDSVNSVQPKFDHYSQADNIGTVGAGKYKGATDNYSCATADATDPVYAYKSCANKTLWYKFTSTVTGNVRFRMRTNNKDYKYYYDAIQLFRQVIPGDSTTKGLAYEQYTSTPYQDGSYWSQTCISKGTYYLLLTGCNQVNEDVYPEIEIIESAGDYCSAPLTAKITGPGSSEAKLIVDCHTIGTDYGEFGPKLTCPADVPTAQYKSSWFRIDITGKDTLDVTAFIEETTGAASSEIKYRMMTGDCGAMQEQSCVQDALTQNTYECLIPGQSYYIQVLTPLLKNGYPVTGDIKLKLSAKLHADKCSPPPPCLANANFQAQFDCNKDSAVRFVNYSTYGSSIKYTWDFGYNGRTSNEVSPSFFYPALTSDQTYKVRLITENTSCGKKDTAEANVFMPARPYVNLGADTSLCILGSTLTLNATSHSGATYKWQDGSTNPTFEVKNTGRRQYTVKVDYKTCSSSDTINVFINPLQKNPLKNQVLCSESVQLSVYRGQGESYLWNTGSTGSGITVKQPGTYWVDLNLHGCSVRDSFIVSTLEEARPLGNDTTVCLQGKSYQLNATVGGANWYRWQDGSGGATHTVTKAGIYWVDINIGNCTIRDSITITASTPPSPVINGGLQFCAGDSVQLDAGTGYASYTWSNGATTQKINVTSGGSYRVTVTDDKGCSGTSPAVQVVRNNNPKPSISGNRALCFGDSLTLNAGTGYASFAWSTGETAQSVKIKNSGKVILTVTDSKGCTGKDSVTVTIGAQPVATLKDTAICQGSSYKLPSGRTVNTTGVYKDTLQNKTGCDSLFITTNLTVLPVHRTSKNAAICAGQTYTLPSGRPVTAAGTYTETLKAVTGCDSIVTVRLIVNATVTTTINATICEGQSYKLPSGQTVSTAGSYTHTLQASYGCDSIVVTNLVVKSATTQNKTASICAGDSYQLPSGRSINTAGLYRDTVKGAAGCDSLITVLNLSLAEKKTEAVAAAICAGETYTLPSGAIVNKSGVYKDTIRYMSGCDSLVSTVTLTVNPIQRTTVRAVICTGQGYTLPLGRVVNTSGNYLDTLQSAAGCDSIITTQLTVSAALTSTVTAAICAGDSYQLPSGKVVNTSGTYVETLRTAAGCDSIVTTRLTVRSVLSSEQRVSICPEQSFTLPSGAKATQSGTYVNTVKSVFGCDSTITTYLAVKTLKQQNLSATVCQGQAYTMPSGKLVRGDGMFRDTLQDVAGCDSLVTILSLRETRIQFKDTAASVCEGQFYTLPWGGMVKDAGTYKDTVRTVMGCDSIISTATLTVRARDPFGISPSAKEVCIGGTVQLRAFGGDSYQWLPADGMLNNNADQALVQPTATTTYQAIVSNPICEAMDTVATTVVVNPLPVVGITKSNDVDCMIGISKLNATGGAIYQWTPTASLSNPRSRNPVASPSETTTYRVKVTSAKGCVSEETIKVVVDIDKARFDLPNAFTPNGDGNNDCFGVKTWGAVSDLKLTIYSRWGELIWETTDPRQCWDGTYKGKQMETAVFIYQVTANTICGKVYRKGLVTLIR